MLDASTRIDVLNLLGDLKARGLGILFITHDLSLGNYISDRTMILRSGVIVEMGATDEGVRQPAAFVHADAARLGAAAAPQVGGRRGRVRPRRRRSRACDARGARSSSRSSPTISFAATASSRSARLLDAHAAPIPWEDRPAGYTPSDLALRAEPRHPARPAARRSNSIFNSAVVPFEGGFAGVFRCDDWTRRMQLHRGFSPDGRRLGDRSRADPRSSATTRELGDVRLRLRPACRAGSRTAST